MPAKKKSEEETPAAIEETPAPAVTPENQDVIPTAAAPAVVDWNAPEIIASQDHWPDRQEPRTLPVKLTDHELAGVGYTLTETLDECEAVKSAAKAAADDAKSRIEALTGRTTKLKNIIRDGSERREVSCKWFYGIAGVMDGAVIFDPDKRACVRLDTGEVVSVERIPEIDRQMPLALEEEPTEVPAEEPEISLAYAEGAKAFADGIQRHKCPHSPGSLDAQEWKQGWNDAADKKELEAA